MMNGFLEMLMRFFMWIFVLIFVFAGADTYFNISKNLSFKSALGLNAIFALSSGVIMLAIFFILLLLDFTLPFLKSDTAVTLFGISVYIVMVFILKSYLISRYGLSFRLPYVVISFNVLLMLTPVHAIYLFIKALANAFKNH